jgi:hypothetical protein
VHAHVERGYRENEQEVFCRLTHPDHRVAFRVRECSSYTESKGQTLREMEEMAWILAPRGSKRTTGFVHNSELRNEDGDIEWILDENSSSRVHACGALSRIRVLERPGRGDRGARRSSC